MFREQVNTVSNWFKSWSECEQTVALYSLLKRLSPTQVKFIAQVLEQGATENSQVQRLEEEANSPDYISKLCGEPKEKAVTQLLSHLPLLRTGNADAKTAYLKIIPQVLSYSIDNGVHIEESRQLLSFSLIHPAITCEERSQFTMWLGYLEERFTYSIYHQNRQNNFQSKSAFSNRSGEDSLQQQQQGVPAHINLANSGCLNGWNERSAASDSMPALTLEGSSTERLGPILAKYAKPGANRNNTNSGNGDRGVPSHSVHGKLAGHVPLHATSSAPPNTASVQGGQSDNLLNWLGIDTCKSLQELSSDPREDWLPLKDKPQSSLLFNP